MWALYKKSFRLHLEEDLQCSPESAAKTTGKAKAEYKAIIARLPEFEKADSFKTNIVNCAMLVAFLKNMDRRPSVEELTVFYENTMKTNGATKLFCKMGGKKKFSPKDIKSMKATAALRAGDRNQYSWNMDFIPYEDGSGYEARFTSCGICTLMREHGFYDLVPAMCHLDYTMSTLGGTSVFIREHTLASGGPYCDCGYKKK